MSNGVTTVEQLLGVSLKGRQRAEVVALLPEESLSQVIPIPPIHSTGTSPLEAIVARVGSALFLAPTFGTSSLITGPPPRTDDVFLPESLTRSLAPPEVPMPNGNGFGFDLSSFLPDLDYGQIFQQGITQIGLPLLQAELGVRPLSGGGGLPAVRAPVGLPAVVPPGMGMMMGRFASRFPNLAGALTALRLAGRAVTRSRAWSLLRQLGPAGLIGLGFTAEAINELLIAGPGHRRLNPLNPRALSRATRRLLGFERRVATVEGALSGVCRSRIAGRRRGRARCRVCHKSPCIC